MLLAGAGQVAERKAESLLHAGAALRVVAAELNPRFQGWLQQGRIEWLGPDFQTAFLNDVFLVVAATDDEALNRRIFQAAEKQGKIVQHGRRSGFVFVYRAGGDRPQPDTDCGVQRRCIAGAGTLVAAENRSLDSGAHR